MGFLSVQTRDLWFLCLLLGSFPCLFMLSISDKLVSVLSHILFYHFCFIFNLLKTCLFSKEEENEGRFRSEGRWERSGMSKERENSNRDTLCEGGSIFKMGRKNVSRKLKCFHAWPLSLLLFWWVTCKASGGSPSVEEMGLCREGVQFKVHNPLWFLPDLCFLIHREMIKELHPLSCLPTRFSPATYLTWCTMYLPVQSQKESLLFKIISCKVLNSRNEKSKTKQTKTHNCALLVSNTSRTTAFLSGLLGSSISACYTREMNGTWICTNLIFPQLQKAQ